MRTVETRGADIEDAIEKGLKQLDVARENVIVEILEEPNRGLLGLGSKEAVVRLTTVVPPRSEREHFVSSAPAVEEQPSQSEDTSSERSRDHRKRDRRGDRSRGGRDGRRGGRGRNFRGRGGGRKRYDREEERRLQQEIQTIEPRRKTVVVEDDAEIPDGVKVGAETLTELLDHMNMDGVVRIERIQAEDDEELQLPWLLHVHGDDLGALIGRRGDTLSALQYITRLIASRDLQERAEFSVDVEDYKARREIQLERLAVRKAEEAIQRGRTIHLDPMSPNERRIIHMALRPNPKVKTESVGEGQHRRVTIIPNDAE